MIRPTLLVVLALAAACTFDGQVGDEDEREDAGSLSPDGGDVTTPDAGEVSTPDGGEVTTPDAGTVEGCGSVTAAGECDGNDAIWCEDGEIARVNCAGSEIGGTGCTSGACVGVAAGRACDTLRHCSAGLTCTNAICTAPNSATLQITVTGQGTVTSTPPAISCPGTCATTGVQGDQVSLTATASSGWTFQSWETCSVATTPSITVTLTNAVTCRAVFEESLPVPGTATIAWRQMGPGRVLPNTTLWEGRVVWNAAGTRFATFAGKDFRYFDAVAGTFVGSATEVTTNELVDRITALAWNPAGTIIAAGLVQNHASYRLHLRNLATNAVVTIVATPHTKPITDVAWSPDGTLVGTSSSDGTIALWNATTGVAVRTWNNPAGDTYSLKWSPDGARLAALGKYGVTTWSTAATYPLEHHFTVLHTMVGDVDWSHDSTRVTASSNDTIYVWNAIDGTLEKSWANLATEQVDPSFDPSGTRLATRSDWGGDVVIWNIAAASVIRTIPGSTNEGVADVAWSPNTSTIALTRANDEGSVRLVDADTGTVVRSFGGARNEVRALAFNPNREELYGASSDGAVYAIAASTGAYVRDIDRFGVSVNALSLSPAGTELVGALDSAVFVWTTATGTRARNWSTGTPGLGQVKWSSTNAIATSGLTTSIKLWPAAGGATPTKTLIGQNPISQQAVRLDWHPGGGLLASTGEQSVQLWDAETGIRQSTLNCPESGNAYAGGWSPDGTRFAGACISGMTIWSTASGTWGASEPILATPLTTAVVRHLAWRPDGLVLAGVTTNGIHLWNAATGSALMTQPIVSDGTVNAMTWSDDGERLYVGTAAGTITAYSIAP